MTLRSARELDRATIVVMLSDGGWEYLSAKRWTADLPQLEEEMERSVWC